jgi:hypothetical protein
MNKNANNLKIIVNFLVFDSFGNLKKMCYILLRGTYYNAMTKIQDMFSSTSFSHSIIYPISD